MFFVSASLVCSRSVWKYNGSVEGRVIGCPLCFFDASGEFFLTNSHEYDTFSFTSFTRLTNTTLTRKILMSSIILPEEPHNTHSSHTLKTKRKVLPGQPGTKKLQKQYGDRLICVRYRYDTSRNLRVKTVELIVDEQPWQPDPQRRPPPNSSSRGHA